MPDQITPGDVQTILELEKETFAAIHKRDAAVLDRILDDRFVYRSPSGAPDLNKTEFIRSATTLPVEILSVWGENLQVNIYGETAILTGVQHAQFQTDDGKEVISSVAFTDIFVKRLNNWRMALAFGVELGATTPQSTPDK